MIQFLISNPYVVLFLILTLGLFLGTFEFKGISLGSSGVLFVALLFGHYQYVIPSGIGTLGLILFVFSVGISAGPRFFNAFAKQGIQLAKMSVCIALSASVVTLLLAKILRLPDGLALGIFAGSLTSTPALASAIDALKGDAGLVSVGYGISYPFGVIGVVLFVQLLPKFLNRDLTLLSRELDSKEESSLKVETALIRVRNSALFGKNIVRSDILSSVNCRVLGILKDRKIVPIRWDTPFEENQIINILGEEKGIKLCVEYLGETANVPNAVPEYERDMSELVVTSQMMAGRSIRELQTLRNDGVHIVKIMRNDVPFVPNRETVIEPLDILTVTGSKKDIEIFSDKIGHNVKALHRTDVFSLVFMILLGVVIGLVPISVGGIENFKLGVAGGILLVSLLLGHIGRVGKIVGRVPAAARNIMMELGLIFFLAHAGVQAGDRMLEVFREYGIAVMAAGFICTVVPMVSGYLYATYFLKLNLLETLGGTCGGMTSTPALGVIQSKTDSSIPIISYATAYPVALILMLFLSQLLLLLLQY